MNKFGMVLGLAAVATLAGCKDPEYKHAGTTSQNEVKPVNVEVAAKPAETDVKVEQTITVEEVKPAEVKPAAEVKPVVDVKPVEPETTIYIVQNGDYLAKISKKYNVTISSIKRINGMKSDVIRVGQKLKLPGKIDVGEQTAPAKPVAKAKTPGAKTDKKSSYKPYAGATKEYVVKNGDTLGAIAYGNGITIRQLKELNSLTSNALKIGQKLKVPAEKVVKAAKPAAKEAAPVAATPAVAEPVAPAPADDVAAPAAEATPAEPAAVPEAAAPAPAEAAPAPAADTATYIVQEGDDITGVSIRWGVSAADIRQLNNLAEGDKLVPGQTIKLPADVQQ